MTASVDQLLKVCKEVIAPLIQADAGSLYIVAVEGDQVTLHLAGRCAGCPGSPLVVQHIIEPAIKAAAPGASVVVTHGIVIPEGASLIEDAPKG